MTDQHKRGGVYVCGVCRVGLEFDHRDEQYKCPECGWVKE